MKYGLGLHNGHDKQAYSRWGVPGHTENEKPYHCIVCGSLTICGNIPNGQSEPRKH